MDHISVPYRVEVKVATFEGDWTAEEIDAGLATLKSVETVSEWYEADGTPITDERRIAEVEHK